MLAKFLVSTFKKYSILHKLLFVSVDNASHAKSQVEIIAEQEILLIEIAAHGET